MAGTGHLPCTALCAPPITPGIGNLSHYKMPRGHAFHSAEAQETSLYKHRLQKGETAGDSGLLWLLERTGTAHTRNQSIQGSKSCQTGTARAVVGLPPMGSLPRDSSGLQHTALQPATPWLTTAALAAGISGTAGIFQGSAVISFCLVQHYTHVGKRAWRNCGCQVPSSIVTRAVALPQDANTQLNTPAAPDTTLGMLLHLLPLGLQRRDFKCPSPCSVCLMFSGYCGLCTVAGLGCCCGLCTVG